MFMPGPHEGQKKTLYPLGLILLRVVIGYWDFYWGTLEEQLVLLITKSLPDFFAIMISLTFQYAIVLCMLAL